MSLAALRRAYIKVKTVGPCRDFYAETQGAAAIELLRKCSRKSCVVIWMVGRQLVNFSSRVLSSIQRRTLKACCWMLSRW